MVLVLIGANTSAIGEVTKAVVGEVLVDVVCTWGAACRVEVDLPCDEAV